MKTLALSAVVLGFTCASLATAAEPDIIAKARGYLGTEEALNAVTSIHMVGRLSGDNPVDPKKPLEAAIDIVFQKPYEEAITVLTPDAIVRTCLSDTEAWREQQSPRTAGQVSVDVSRNWSLTLLGTDQAKVLRVDTLENLFFYRGVEQVSGQMVDEGQVSVNGVACEKIKLSYDSSATYHRFFDLSTGRLVYTETENGGQIRETGEIMAGGIRFPKSIVITDKGADGKPSVKTYEFETVTVNQAFPPEIFHVPLLPPMPTHPAVTAPASVAAPAVNAFPSAAPAPLPSNPAAAPAPAAPAH